MEEARILFNDVEDLCAEKHEKGKGKKEKGRKKVRKRKNVKKRNNEQKKKGRSQLCRYLQ